MKILYFTRDYTTHDRYFLLKMAESRHKIFFLRLEDDGITYEKRPLPEGVIPIEWRGGKQSLKKPEDWLRLMPDFCSVIDNVKPDLVHAGPVQSCGFMTALAGFHPFLLMSWGSDILVDAFRNDFWRWITKYTIDRSDYFYCDCQAVKDKIKDITNYKDENILQHSWGVDLDEFGHGPDKTNLKERLLWKDKIVVLSTRTWEPLYGVDILLKAFQQAYSNNDKLRLILIGDGSQAEKVQKFIRENNLQEIVYLPGRLAHEQIPDVFRACDIYISCSYSDGSSISLLEAMTTGLPVVVTDCESNREWIMHGENGWLVPQGDFNQFAEFLLSASEITTADRERIKISNRKISESLADRERNFVRLNDLYDKIEKRLGKS